MSWIVDSKYTWWQRFCLNVIRTGPVPRHMAFIMDGNRRYAKKQNIQKIDGHTKGFNKMAETLQWCYDLGIHEVTVYAFSIENFKRTQEEVDTLMQLAKDKFEVLLQEERLMKDGVCVRIIGNLDLVSEDLRKIFAKVVLKTKDNNRLFMNIAFSYTSRDEITNAVQTIVEGVENGHITEDDVDEELVSKCLYTNKSPDPDLLVRTSGEVRFSDFLLWQISSTQVVFTEVLWPEFCLWHLLAAVFYYQRNYELMQSVKEALSINSARKLTPKVGKFLEHVEQKRYSKLVSYVES